MRVALAQMNIVWEDKERNTDKVKEWLAEAKNNGADAIFFPEMSLTGFSMNTKVTAENERETVHVFEQFAKTFGLSIGVGWVKQCGDMCENHYSIVDSEAGEVLDYAKIHPFSYSDEDRFFKGGDSLGVCRLDDMNIGAVICYDLRFPEIFQILSDKADFIVVPANWPEARRAHWLTLLEARAIENQCFIAGINCCGMMNGSSYSGDSCLFGADGTLLSADEIIAMDAECADEKLLIYDIENNTEHVRKAFPVKRDRRCELYRSLESR